MQDIEQETQGIDLGDKRLNYRCSRILNSLNKGKGSSICSSHSDNTELTGAYRFLRNKKVMPDKVLEPHIQKALDRAAEYSELYVIQDTTELDYSSQTKLEGVGNLGQLYRRGLFMHTSLISTKECLPLGCSKLDFIIRDDEKLGKSEQNKKKPIEEKESYRWVEGYRHACDIAAQLPGKTIFSVADRESDIYEIYAEAKAKSEQEDNFAYFVIRAKENRSLIGEHKGKKLFDLTSLGASLGMIEYHIPKAKKVYREKGNNRNATREQRKVKQEIRYCKVEPRVPYRKDKKLPPLSLYMISAVESSPPTGEPPIVWRILTNYPIEALEDAKKIIKIYTERWTIETFFRTLKSGCQVEKLQLKDVESVKRAVTLLCIVCWRQHYFTNLSRKHPQGSCERVFPRDEWEATYRVLKKEIKEVPCLSEFFLEVAKLGGYLARKHDAPPGSKVIWKGLAKVEAYAEAWVAFTST